MTDCAAIEKSLGAWLDGEVSRSEAETVGAHVKNCASCAAERRRLVRLQASIEEALRAEASRIGLEPFLAGVGRRIAERRPWPSEWLAWIRSASPAPRLAWAAPLAIVAIVAFFSIEPYLPEIDTASRRSNFAAVESIDAHGFNVALFREDETRTTVIWLFENQEGDDDSSGEADPASRSF